MGQPVSARAASQGRLCRIRTPLRQFGNLSELRIAAQQVRQPRAALQFRLRPQRCRLHSIQEPVLQGCLFEVFPPRQVPAALVFGLLDERDIAVCGDNLQPSRDGAAITLRPMRGQFGDWNRSVPLEPGGFKLPSGDLPRHDDLKMTFSKLQRRHFLRPKR